MRTGILGGTFDPIHIAHLHAADCALRRLRLDRVLMMPAGDPWQKADRAITPSYHRLAMCQTAIADVDQFEVDDREIDRDGPTYTVDTLATFPDDEELFLILGADAATGLRTWHRWEGVVARARFAIAPRPGVAMPEIPNSVALDTGLLEISGTSIRSAVRSGAPWRFLVPPGVYEYIRSHDLYAKPGGDDMVEESSNMESSS